ncbi:MAG: hypothetical protein KF718_33275 [Polyangiaceae bacterium]|nr:hypothetical protein [Polyangiaceae bacterium]
MSKKNEEHTTREPDGTLEQHAREQLGVAFDPGGRIVHRPGKAAEEALVAGLRARRGGAVGQVLSAQAFARELASLRQMEIR